MASCSLVMVIIRCPATTGNQSPTARAVCHSGGRLLVSRKVQLQLYGVHPIRNLARMQCGLSGNTGLSLRLEIYRQPF